MHLLGVATLYWSAFNLIQLLFDFVNVRFPDPLNPYYDAGNAMRWSIASLTIIFPVFVLISWFLNRDMKANPEKAEIKIRKWLVYLTLFLAAILIIGDLVALIYNFLGGELTTRFFLKVVEVFLVAGAIFGYYLYDLRKKEGKFSSGAKSFIWSVGGIVLLSIIYGFFIAGSPFTQRMVRFDSQRVNDLQILQSQVVNYWQTKNKLPPSLDDLKDSISGFVPPRDPESGATYVYQVKGSVAFQLCATFNLSSSEAQVRAPKLSYPALPGVSPDGTAGENWNHGVGEQCFNRTIDPERYPPFNKAQR